MIILVSGATRTVRRLRADHASTLGELIVPASGNWPSPGRTWACDNGAFSGFDEAKFVRMMERLRGIVGCRFVTAPDVVADSAATLVLFDAWESRIRERGYPVALVAQDGLVPGDVPWERIDALFIGGSTEWKLSVHARALVENAKRRGKWVHVGRVNTRKRMTRMMSWGVDSIDGTQWSRWADTHLARGLRHVERCLAQGKLAI